MTTTHYRSTLCLALPMRITYPTSSSLVVLPEWPSTMASSSMVSSQLRIHVIRCVFTWLSFHAFSFQDHSCILNWRHTVVTIRCLASWCLHLGFNKGKSKLTEIVDSSSTSTTNKILPVPTLLPLPTCQPLLKLTNLGSTLLGTEPS